MTKMQRVLDRHRPAFSSISAWSPHNDHMSLVPAISAVPTRTIGPLRPVPVCRQDGRQPAPVIPMLGALVAPTRPPRRLTALPEPRRVPVTVDFSRPDVRLPFGVPRFVNAATLRAMAGGRPFDRLLKKIGDAWEFVKDETMIDLLNGTQLFKLGRITIYS
jgi:hypothetical protein